VIFYLVSIFDTADDAAAAFAQQRDGCEFMATDPTSTLTARVTDSNGQQFGDQDEDQGHGDGACGAG
jgi:hypothetical protein